ncbi:DUF5684 domain-containing protein [Leifsonia sp. Root4]|uniref:DUF5684 domain-containing protein n=1 Tax=Leifsonia sp. Root4 TaxID=1736525 RepID=UPI000A85A3A6|nr:DUF5684 domain-containing protein [Leifsonia sp. Root4]
MSDNSVPGFGVLIALLLSLAFYVWASAALAAVFSKLGEPGWKAWVPVYSSFVLFRLGGVAPLWAITLFLPLINVVGFVFSILAIHSISKQFGKGAGFTVLGVLLTPIWSSILGWGRATAGQTGAGQAGAVLTGAVLTGAGQPDAAAPVAVVSPFGITSGDAVPARIPFGETVQPAAPPISAAPVSPTAPVSSAGPAAPAVSVPAAAPAVLADEAVQESPTAPPVFSYTPAVIATPSPVAPPAPIEMPEELSVRVEQAAGAPARAATPLIDSVPDFSSPVVPAAAASVVLDEQRAETPAPQPADDDDDMDATVIAGRRNKAWVFETESGQRVPLSAEVVLLGRNPAPLDEHPDAQLITVRDAGRTVSKTHASVQLQGAAWVITDLNSTNGVYVLDAEGAENELEPGIATEIAGRFVLGELSARIFQEE